MRIAMFMPRLGPDALGWNVHLDFAEAARDLGYSFELLTTRPASDGANDTASDGARRDRAGDASAAIADVLQCSEIWEPMGRVAAPLLRTRGLLPAAAALAGWLRRDGDACDVLHVEVAYPHAAAAALAIAASRWKGALAVSPMGEDTLIVADSAYGFRRFPAPRGLIAWTLRRAALVRSISPLIDRQLAEIAPGTPRRVIPLNISAAAVDAARRPDEREARRRRARAALDARHGTAGIPVVLALGRLHPFKGIDQLVEALPSLPGTTLLVVGPSLRVRPFGDVADSLQRRAVARGVDDRVRYLGAVPPEWSLEMLAAADVVVVPSHLESLNKVCMEAAAVGTPFVVTETTGISASVPERGVGIVVPPRNPAALGWAIAEILEGHWQPDPEGMRDFALQFSPQRIARRVTDFYEEVVAGATPQAGRASG